MKNKLLVLLLACLVCALIFIPVSAAGTTVSVSIADFSTTLNGVTMDNAYAAYPLIVYNQITYFPMTYYDCRFMGVETDWNQATSTLKITATGINESYHATLQTARNAVSDRATIADYNISVNGTVLNNATETYPLLTFREVTYFPMTWRFCVDEFGWNYAYSNETGLVISSSKNAGTVSRPVVIDIDDDDFGDTKTGSSRSGGGNGVTIPDHEEYEGNLVWVPVNGGKKYHWNRYCSSMDDPMQVTVETAIANGYTPCKRCYGH